MKTKGVMSAMLCVTSVLLLGGASTVWSQVYSTKPAGGNENGHGNAQAIWDSLNSEHTSMRTEDGEVDQEEVEHVQRMIRLYELRAGFVDVKQARKDLGLHSESSEMAQAQSPLQDELQQLRAEIADLRQQLQVQQLNQFQGNGRIMNDAAGAANDPYLPSYPASGYYRYPKHW